MANTTTNDTRLSTVLFADRVFHQNLTHPMADIRRGGQFGWHHDMQGIVNSTPHVSNNVICRVLASPRGFDYVPSSPEVWHGAWKALFELHPTSIEGLNKTLKPNWNGEAWGGSGEQIEVPVGMTREASDITFTINEKYGLPVTHMVEQYHRLFVMDEDTKHPGIAMLVDEIPDGLLDFYTWTMIFIEPDRYMQFAQRAWIIANMAPKTSANVESKRDKTSDQSTLNITLNMTGVAQVGFAVDQVANNILRSMRQTQADPMRAPAYMQGPTGDLADRDVGFQEMMEQAQRDMISPDT